MRHLRDPGHRDSGSHWGSCAPVVSDLFAKSNDSKQSSSDSDRLGMKDLCHLCLVRNTWNILKICKDVKIPVWISSVGHNSNCQRGNLQRDDKAASSWDLDKTYQRYCYACSRTLGLSRLVHFDAKVERLILEVYIFFPWMFLNNHNLWTFCFFFLL